MVETILEAKAEVITLSSTPALELETKEDRKRVRSFADNTATCPFRSPWEEPGWFLWQPVAIAVEEGNQ